MNCPLCSKTAEDSAVECPSCGVLFAKLRERKDRERTKAATSPPLFSTSSSALYYWRWHIAAVAVVVAWLLGFGLYYHARAGKTPRPKKPLTNISLSTAKLRNPATGKLENIEIYQSPAYSRPQPPPMLLKEPVRPNDAPADDPEFDNPESDE